MSETLFTCPVCQQGGFTARGLQGHQGTKACKQRAANQPLAIVPKAPALKSGRDSMVVATQLDELISDAESGLRRIVRAGLYIVEISQDLPHGQFGPWIEAHLPNRSRATIFGWKALALNVMETCGLKVQQLDFSKPLHEVLALPAAEVPADAKEARRQIDELIEGKTYRQLFLEFKQSEEQTDDDGETTVVPSHGGDVTPRDATGKRKTKRRRTKLEITKETFEADSQVAMDALKTALDNVFAITGPKDEKAWDILKPKELEALKLLAKDLYDGTQATEARRTKATLKK